MNRKEELQDRFNKANLLKTSSLFNQTRVFQELIMFMDYKIRSEVKTFTLLSLCGSERSKFMVDIYFQKAFSNLTLLEKIELYQKTIKIAIQIQALQTETKQSLIDINVEDDQITSTAKKEPVRFRVQIQKGFRSWNQVYLNIDGFKVSSEEMQFDLRNYLIRRSKKTDKECYVLEAIHMSTPEIVRFCFLTNNDLKKFLPLFNELINKGYTQMIKRMYNIEVKSVSNSFGRGTSPPKSKIQKNLRLVQMTSGLKVLPDLLQEQIQLYRPAESRIVQQVLKVPEQQNLSHELSQIIAQDNQQYQKYQERVAKIQKKYNKQTWYKNNFIVMFPNYNLNDLDHFERYQLYDSKGENNHNCFVFRSTQNPLVFKLQLLLNRLQVNVALQALTNLPLYKNWHPQILEGQIKLGISSQNSIICYQKHRSFSQWYKQRDYLYLRHQFQMGNDYYIADKSIQNTNFIPLNTIHRGKIQYQIMKLSPSSSGCKLVIQCHFQHGGLLNRPHICQLTTRYLKGFQKMQQYFSKSQFKKKLKNYLKHQWKVRQMPNQESFKHIKSNEQSQMHDSQFDVQQVVSGIDESDVFFSIQDDKQNQENLRKSVHQLNEEQIVLNNKSDLDFSPVTIRTNEQGLVLVSKEYLRVHHPINIIEKTPRNKLVPKFKDYLIKDIWTYLQEGGLLLTNKKLKQAQDSVISFILTTLKKNLFSGKGGLNISLPVTIFHTDSNLSRFCFAMSAAPQFLEAAAKSKDPIERFKYCMIFGLTNSLLFLGIEKSFNPILGETYQCHIAGCPVYAQQISHHPPISSLLMYGRGYKIHASLEATVNIHMNAADGINKGWYHIVFDDGQQICFQTPPAEFNGFAIGDRKFNYIKKGYYFDMANNLYSQMNFEDTSGMFSSNKWKFKDQIQAQILTVKSEFLNNFIANFRDKKLSPSSKDILDRHNKLTGRWTHQIYCDNVEIYSFHRNLPYQLNEYPYPLPSNTNYRQDLYYRVLNDLARSQIQKQRLQNIQRGDRKCREKYGPKKQKEH